MGAPRRTVRCLGVFPWLHVPSGRVAAWCVLRHAWCVPTRARGDAGTSGLAAAHCAVEPACALIRGWTCRGARSTRASGASSPSTGNVTGTTAVTLNAKGWVLSLISLGSPHVPHVRCPTARRNRVESTATHGLLWVTCYPLLTGPCSSADHVSHPSKHKPGFGLLALRNKCSFISHLVYALLHGQCARGGKTCFKRDGLSSTL